MIPYDKCKTGVSGHLRKCKRRCKENVHILHILRAEPTLQHLKIIWGKSLFSIDLPHISLKIKYY